MGRSVVALQCFPSSVRRKREEAYHKLPVRARGTGDVGSFSPYFMLLFDSVGHYFRLRREMLSGSRFTPRSPSRFFLCSPLLSFFSPCPRSTSLSPPLILEPIARTGRNMSSFLANLTSALMQPPCSSHDFDPRNHRHSTPLFALFLCLSTWTNNIRENCLIPKYTHIPSRRWLSNDAKIDVIRLEKSRWNFLFSSYSFVHVISTLWKTLTLSIERIFIFLSSFLFCFFFIDHIP